MPEPDTKDPVSGSWSSNPIGAARNALGSDPFYFERAGSTSLAIDVDSVTFPYRRRVLVFFPRTIGVNCRRYVHDFTLDPWEGGRPRSAARDRAEDARSWTIDVSPLLWIAAFWLIIDGRGINYKVRAPKRQHARSRVGDNNFPCPSSSSYRRRSFRSGRRLSARDRLAYSGVGGEFDVSSGRRVSFSFRDGGHNRSGETESESGDYGYHCYVGYRRGCSNYMGRAYRCGNYVGHRRRHRYCNYTDYKCRHKYSNCMDWYKSSGCIGYLLTNSSQ